MPQTRRDFGKAFVAFAATALMPWNDVRAKPVEDDIQAKPMGQLHIGRYAPSLATNGEVAILSGGAPIGANRAEDHFHSSLLATVESIDPVSLRQTFLANGIYPRANHASVWAGGQLWLIGGRTRDGTQPRILLETERIDIDTQAIWRGPDLPLALTNLTAAVECADVIYVFGGSYREMQGQTSQVSNRVFACAPPYTGWQERAPMQISAGNVTPVVVSDHIYVIGGYDGENAHAITQVYDPRTDRWTFGPPPPRRLSAHAAAAIGDRIFCFGDYQVQTSLLALDIGAGEWREPDLSFLARRHVRAVTVGNRIVVAGGNQSSVAPAVDAIESYDSAQLDEAFRAAG